MTLPALRIAIWIDDLHVSKIDRDFIEWAGSEPGIELTSLLVSPSPSIIKPSRTAANAIFNALTAIEGALLRRRSARYREHRCRFDVRSLAIGASTPTISSVEVRRLPVPGLDLIVFLGAEMPSAGISIPSRLGTIAFEAADPRHRRGVPAAFWEVFERRDTTGFALEHFAAGQVGGDVLLRGKVPTRHFYLLNEAALLEKSYHYLRVVISRIAASGQLPTPSPSTPDSQRPAEFPSARQSLAYLGRFFAAMAGKRLRRLRGREEVWQVAFLRSGWRGAALWQGVPIANPPGRYLADPFVIRREDGDYCYVEDFDSSRQRGCISVYKLGAAAAERLGIVIDEPFHLSFPYLFEYQGALYMCPESSANKDIRLYRCVEFPMKWQLEKVVMAGVAAVDTMIFPKDGKWWLFANMDPGNTGELASELYIFSADSPLAATWKPHIRNPLVIDAGYARNAGLLLDGDKVFRVSQRQGFARYGKGSQINEIIDLTDETYDERCIELIEPNFREGLLGTHHLHCRDGLTVFDFLAEAPVRHAFAASDR